MKKFLAGLVAVSLLGCVNFAAMAEEATVNDSQEVVAAEENTEKKTEEEVEEKNDENTDKNEEVSDEKNEENKEENQEVSPENAEETAVEPDAAENELSVEVNGEKVVFPDAKPFIDENDRTLIPLRAIGEALDLKVEWDGEARTASFIGDEKTVVFTIDETEYEIVSGEEIEKAQMDTKAIISEDRTYAPVRFLAEAFGFVVEWNQDTKTVIIKEDAVVGELPQAEPVKEVENAEEPAAAEGNIGEAAAEVSEEANA